MYRTEKNLGRDHFPDLYTMIFAGGGVRSEYVYGARDDLGFRIVRDKVRKAYTIWNRLSFTSLVSTTNDSLTSFKVENIA